MAASPAVGRDCGAGLERSRRRVSFVATEVGGPLTGAVSAVAAVAVFVMLWRLLVRDVPLRWRRTSLLSSRSESVLIVGEQ